jgi:hypothetical protein
VSLGTAIYGRLSADAGVAALVGDRVYPTLLPQPSTFPAVTYAMVGSPWQTAQDGSRIRTPRYRLVCWAKSYDEADAVGAAVAAALHLWRDPPDVDPALVDDETEDREAETGLFRRDIEVVIWRKTA